VADRKERLPKSKRRQNRLGSGRVQASRLTPTLCPDIRVQYTGMLQNPSVNNWLGGIVPAWTLRMLCREAGRSVLLCFGSLRRFARPLASTVLPRRDCKYTRKTKNPLTH
jgi:hypothetical protein